nr:reverse transcriptase domain-containing protein [Tanacetum cinerariifolium]
MSTRSSARNLFPPLDNLELTIQRRSCVDPTLLNDFEMATEGNSDPPVPDLRTIEELCQPTLNGQGGSIAPISIQATNFGFKNDMIQQSIKVNGVTDDALRLYLFPHSLTHHATAWFDSLPRNSINTFEQMAKMFLGKYFPPSMVTKLRNEITNFRQRPGESLFEDTSVQQSDSSSSITSSSDQEIVSLKAEMAEINKNLIKVLQINQQVKAVTPSCETCGGPHSYNDCPATVGQTQNVYAAGAYQGGNSYNPKVTVIYLAIVRTVISDHQGLIRIKTETIKISTSKIKTRIKETIMVFLRGTTKEGTNSPKELVKLIKPRVTKLRFINPRFLTTKLTNYMKMNTASSSGTRTLPSNTITNMKEDLKGITTQSGIAYEGPTIPTTSYSLPQVVERKTKVAKDMVPPTNNGSTKDIQPLVVQTKIPIPNSELVVAPVTKPVVAPVSALKPNQKPSIPYPSRLHDRKLRDKVNEQKEKFFQMFQDLNFNISFADALILMPKFGLTIKSLLTNKDKLYELARTPLNEHCSAVPLKMLPKKLGDPDKFLIPCDFPGMDECLALVDLGASINLMPLSVWNKLSLPELTPILMTLELAGRSIS